MRRKLTQNVFLPWTIDEVFYGACLRDFLIGSVIVKEGRFFWRVFYPKYQSNTQGEKNKAINHWLVVFFLTVTESWSTCNAYQQPLLTRWSDVQYCFLISFCLYNGLFYSFELKTESTRKIVILFFSGQKPWTRIIQSILHSFLHFSRAKDVISDL